MRSQSETLERAFRAIDQLVGSPIPPPKEPHAESTPPEGIFGRGAFPHCPKCGSFALYRPNNIGNYECMSCQLQDISEEVARRVQ